MSAKRQRTELAEHYASECNRIFASDVISSDDRIEIETLCALAIELIKNARQVWFVKPGGLLRLDRIGGRWDD